MSEHESRYTNGEGSFDELAKVLAAGTLSRRKALRLMGAALFGGALASLPGAAWASHKGTPHGGGGGGGGGKSSCAKYCKTLFGGDTAAHEECVSEGAHGAGPCYSCTPGVGPGPGFTPNCTAPKTQFNANTCQCGCPEVRCVGGTVNQSSCLCECPANRPHLVGSTCLCIEELRPLCRPSQVFDEDSCSCIDA